MSASGNDPPVWSAARIIEATGGRLVCGELDRPFDAVTIDSRKAMAGDVFVAIKGQVHDGHAFVTQVVEKGLKGIITAAGTALGMAKEALQAHGVTCIEVADTTRALQDLAAFHRNRSAVEVAAITGSNGKTTTKAMTAAVVARGYTTLATEGNLNNHIGLPLTLLKIDTRCRWAVVELGMNHAGEIRRLGQICRPRIGVITNIAPAHLEGVGSLEGVADAKAELLETVSANGWAVLNADDPMTARIAVRAKTAVMTFGLGPQAGIRADNIVRKGDGLGFDLILPHERVPIKLATAGFFMVINALAAATVGNLIGLPPAAIKAGLEQFQPVKGRLTLVHLPNAVRLIDDSYNANPGSMTVALETLASLRASGRAILVAGDMRELGDHAAAEHRRMGDLAVRHRVSRIYATGQWAADLAAGALDAGLTPAAITCGGSDTLLAALKNDLAPGDWVLVKGSRAMKMETIVAGLQQWANRQ